VRRPDVIAEHGLLPRAHRTFTRTFGSSREACAAAGLRDSDVMITRGGVVRYAGHYSREQAVEALRAVAAELGRSPAVDEYRGIRERIRKEAVEGEQKLLPSVEAIKRLFGGDWVAACVAAGLADPGEARSTRFTDEELLGWVIRAIEADAAASAAAYDKWRDMLLEEAIKAGTRMRVPVPAAQSVKKRFGGWRRARAAAELAAGGE